MAPSDISDGVNVGGADTLTRWLGHVILRKVSSFHFLRIQEIVSILSKCQESLGVNSLNFMMLYM
jgi:hypothetical protein